jgi:hypothetical protein
MIGAPRIQGKVGQVEEPIELRGQWSFYLKISFLGTDLEPIEFQCPETWPTELKAKEAMRKLATDIVKDVQKKAGFEPTGDFIDFKTNRLNNWEKME